MLENEADSATAEGTDNEPTDTAETPANGVTTRPRRASRPAGPPPEPTAEEPVAEEVAAGEPAAEQPAAEEAPAEEPVAEEPEEAPEEPAAEEPVAEEPVAEEAPEPPKRTRTRSRSAKAAAETSEPVPMTGAETSPEAETTCLLYTTDAADEEAKLTPSETPTPP
ncbi:hypothetical protein, partial [Actinomadura sp. BRA 177]|uniref:hypothetical protein n=1 Tax=Actinomadura sp. BRA 177 TaxID=2745202 RepID=UPI00180D3E2F